jgi:hypothetical protein
MSSFVELQDNVLDHQLNDQKYRNAVKRWLNEGQVKFAAHVDARDFFTPIDFQTTAGEDAYELPSNFLRLVDDEDTNSVANATDPDSWIPFSQMSLREFDDLTTVNGTPLSFAVAGNVLYLSPRPDAVYDIALIYFRKPEAMTADSDEPEISSTYHELLEFYALQRAYERENDYTAGQYWQGRWDAGLQRAAGELHYDTRDGPVIIAGTWGNSLEQPWP